MNATLFSVRGRPLLVTKPNLQQYGHLGLEIVMSLAYARQLGADLYFVRPTRSVCDPLFDLESDQVRIRDPRGLERRGIALRSQLSDLRTRFDEWREESVRTVRQQICLDLERRTRDKSLPRDFRLRLLQHHEKLTTRAEQEREEWDRRKVRSLYYRRRLIRDRVPVYLPRGVEEDAARRAEQFGVSRGARIVTLHVREAGFKLGREIQERKLGARDDSARNGRIESYLKAVEYLLNIGYTIVRMGDPSMTPIRHDGIIDLATSPQRSQGVELYCLLHSEFLICGEAGPAAVSYLTNTPCLTVNATDPISSYPVRSDGIFILKGVIERETDRRLSLEEMLSREYHEHLRNTTRYRYVDNTADEIRDAAAEMVQGARDGWTDAPAQSEFRQQTVRAAEELRLVLPYVRKWGADGGFIGDGRLGRAFAEQYVSRGAAA